MDFVKKFIKSFLYTFFPNICFYCKSPLEYFTNLPLCDSCISNIKFIDSLVCQKCGLPLNSGGAHCYDCKRNTRKLYFDFVRGVVEYKEPIKTLIHEFKYNNKDYLKDFLSKILIKWFKQNLSIYPSIDIICCVPSNLLKKFLRGYNQAELLALSFSKEFGFNFYPNLLIRTKLTVSQFKLSKEERFLNVMDAFKVNNKFKDSVKGKNILIIDDVCTTAETINQCAKVLKEAKAKSIFGLVLARDI